MPDRYGRIGGEDFMLAARGLRAFNDGEKKEEDERQLGLGLGEFSAAATEGRAPARPAGVSDINWAKSSQAAQIAEQARFGVEETRFANEYMGLASKAETPEARINALAQINPGNLAGARALASVQKQVMSNHENQVALLGSVLKKGQAEYDAVLRPGVVAANDLYAKGDEEGAANLLAQLSRTLPMRGEFRWDPQTRTLDHYHNERDAGLRKPEPVDEDLSLGLGQEPGKGLGLGKASPQGAKTGWDGWDGYSYTRSLPVKDALAAVTSMSREDYALQMAGHRVANMEFNAKALEGGGHMAVGANGEKLRVVPLISLGDSTRQFAVFDEKSGKNTAMLDNKGFFDSGIRIVTKEQRALDNDARRISTEERKLGLQERALGLRESGGAGGKTLAEQYVGLLNKHESALAKDDPLSTAEERRAQARDMALGEIRVLTGDENIRSEADVTARSKPARGTKPGGAAPQRPPAPVQGASNDAQDLWSQFRNKK